jgi:hypothetical protein
LELDYLAPAVGGLLYRDALHALLPVVMVDDRGIVLEQSWERGYRFVFGCDSLAQGLTARLDTVTTPEARARKEWRPILLLNGTHQETGHRIITSDITIDTQTCPHAFDFLYLVGRDIPMSTAALNSARFSYLSPAGHIVSADGSKQNLGHILDGGYFENYGARTMRDLRLGLRRIDPRWDLSRQAILVEIVNDTDLTDDDADRSEAAKAGEHAEIPNSVKSDKSSQRESYGTAYGFLNEVIAPIQGLIGTWGSRGVLEAKLSAIDRELPLSLAPAEREEAARAPAPRAFQLRLCPGLSASPPLGWVLGTQSSAAMDGLIDGRTDIFARDLEPDKLKRAEACRTKLLATIEELVKALAPGK